MLKKLVPVILFAFMTACTPMSHDGSMCACCKQGECKCECCKDMKEGKQCPMCLKGKKAHH